MNITKKRIILTSALLILLVVAGYLKYYTTQINSLVKLGYSKEAATSMVNPTTIYNIVSNHKEDLNGSISKHKDELLNLGLNDQSIDSAQKDISTLVAKNNKLSTYKESRITELNNSISALENNAKKMKIKYTYPDNNIYNKYVYINQLVNKNSTKFINSYKKYLLRNGYTNKALMKLKGKTNYDTFLNYQKAVKKEQKKIKSNNGFANSTLKNQAMRMFRETNEYRISKGLKPYKYNYKMQACVFKEANAYASNKNPHNWLCKPAANENAGLASVNSDYVKAAMDFFKSDPPHEAVLSGNYNSVAIAFVKKDGMVYMIMDVFY